jgi:hypothetical protein
VLDVHGSVDSMPASSSSSTSWKRLG